MAVLLMQTTEAPAFPSISSDRRAHPCCPANSIQVRLSLVSVCWHFKTNSLFQFQFQFQFQFSTATRQKVEGSNLCGVEKSAASRIQSRELYLPIAECYCYAEHGLFCKRYFPLQRATVYRILLAIASLPLKSAVT